MLLGILDLSNVLRRYYHGRPEDLHNEQNVNAVRGLDQLLRKIQAGSAVTHLVAAEDSDFSVRKQMFPGYKAGRENPPEDYLRQLSLAQSMLDWWEVPRLSCRGWEADDVAATVVNRVAGRCPVWIYSEDKDLRQLLAGNVCLMRKAGVFTVADLASEWRVRPEQVVDYLALVGDPSDGLPGVPGIGKKSAANMLIEAGSIDGIFELLDDVRPKQREALESHWQQLAAVQNLLTLRRDLDVPRVGSAAEVSLVDAGRFWSESVFSEG